MYYALIVLISGQVEQHTYDNRRHMQEHFDMIQADMGRVLEVHKLSMITGNWEDERSVIRW